jgi:hypothetical protein
MNQKRFFLGGAALILVLVAVLVSFRLAVAQVGPAETQAAAAPLLPNMSSASYSLNWDVLANGGGELASASYRLQSTLGQNAIGTSTSPSFSLHAGFWQLVNYLLFMPLILN